jgi:hemerythrin-like domain-containing protein
MAPQEPGRPETDAQARAGSKRQDALALLQQDHRDVQALFKRYKSAADQNERSAIAERVCRLLRVHTRVEEEIFYPAARRRIEDKELINEALVEHQAAKDLIEEIESAGAGDPMIEARMQVLSEQIEHHVQEEENELFPEVQAAQIDLMGLGARLFERKQEILRELGAEIQDQARAAEPRPFDRQGGGRSSQ